MEKIGAMFKSLAMLATKLRNDVKPFKITTWKANGLAKHSQELLFSVKT